MRSKEIKEKKIVEERNVLRGKYEEMSLWIGERRKGKKIMRMIKETK